MGRAEVHAETSIDAPPTAVYEVLADYRTHHPRIMPPSLFSNLDVESGGVGAGTTFHITLRLAGQEKRLHVQVAEPQPGRVLTETDLDTGKVTEFVVTPVDGGSTTLARMSSEWETAAGLRGMIDRTTMPLLTRWIFNKELRELGRYMRSPEAPR